MARSSGKRQRQRGSIDPLPSGKFRVRVYAGEDPLTGGRHDLVELADTAADAEKLRTKLLSQLDERRNPRTKATVDKLMDRYLEVMEVEATTRRTYEGYIKNHIRPAFGKLHVGDLDGELLETFYGQLRRCRQRCRGRVKLDHYSARVHTCDDRCGPHVCTPMTGSTIRQIHWILSGALNCAVRWRWIATNPVDAARAPIAARPNPTPPSATDAARILQAAWEEDETWGTLVWLVMTTGARRGEICALRRSFVDLDAAVLTVPRSITEIRRQEKDTKTHQQRRIALDTETVEVLRVHFERLDAMAARLMVKPSPDAFLFSYSPSGDQPMHPSSVTHRYGKLVARLGIKTTLHKLRHYNATELIAAGVDVRTVAGRLGHGGGGTTTLRVYAAWLNEADQRAATALGSRLRRPTKGEASK
jgi:integrase